MKRVGQQNKIQSDTLVSLTPSFRRALVAENKSPHTISAYMTSLDQFGQFLTDQGMPVAVADLDREHIEAFITRLLETRSAGTANTRYRGLQQFFRWLVEDDTIAHSPMERMKPPQVPETSSQVLTQEQLKRLVKACEGKMFADRRDTAMISLLMDSGMREGECAGIKVDDLDLDNRTAAVMGKGRRPRVCPFGKVTARDIDRYLRERAKHRDTDSPMLWLGRRGPMTGWGIYQVIQKRAAQAAIDHVHPHLFRHTFSHQYLASGGQENDLMRLTGWRSRTMLARYGASAADERAREAYKSLSPRDRLDQEGIEGLVIRTVDAGLKRLSATRYRIFCGVHGCPEELGHAVHSDDLDTDEDAYGAVSWFHEHEDEFGYAALDDFAVHFPQLSRPRRKTWYLCPPTKFNPNDGKMSPPAKRYRLASGEVHILDPTRRSPRRTLPEDIEIPDGIEMPTASYPDHGLPDFAHVGGRYELPLIIYCPACKKRGFVTRNFVAGLR
ncbi:MAG: tyrosine-type recombinase/integrase [Thermomicrobia bacterium]|nr:tyrosine-type recombinase/integrase [Thermomicrobia bacterium]